MDKQNFYNLAYYLSCLTHNSTEIKDIFNVLCKYYSTQKGYNVKEEEAFDHIINGCQYDNKIHIIISVFLAEREGDSSKRFLRLSKNKSFL